MLQLCSRRPGVLLEGERQKESANGLDKANKRIFAGQTVTIVSGSSLGRQQCSAGSVGCAGTIEREWNNQ